MDTYKDAVLLNDLWDGGAAPWRIWEHGGGPMPVLRVALVTGGRGFVGAWLCRALLERGVEVVSLRPADARANARRRSA